MDALLADITLGDLWALIFISSVAQIIALGLIHGHQR